MRISLWPNGLIAQVGIVLLVAVLLEIVGSTFVLERAEFVSSEDAGLRQIAEQLDIAVRVLEATPVSNRPSMAKTLSEPTMRLDWNQASPPAAAAMGDGAASFREKLVDQAPVLSRYGLVLETPPHNAGHALIGYLRLMDGSRLSFSAADLDASALLPRLYAQFGSIVVLSCCVLLAALFVVRTLAAPLRRLVSATDAIGHGAPVPLELRGPPEMRRVAGAFNAMQQRIAKLLQDRTEALAAVSHDLRTPIARLRLRAGFVASPDDRAALEADLDEMEAMLNDLLVFLGGETDAEKPRPADIAAILQTLADAAIDAGRAASYEGPDHLTLSVRPLGLKRAFSNIVNNALAYGQGVRIALRKQTDTIVITFDDDGPGIALEEQAAVFAPFYRGDTSRNRSQGGMGLGLAISLQAVRRHGGTIDLANREEGGLRVTIMLPA